MIQAQSLTTSENFYCLSSYYPSLLNNYSVNQINKFGNLVSRFRQGFQNTTENIWTLFEFISIDPDNADLITSYINGINVYGVDTMGYTTDYDAPYIANLFINSFNGNSDFAIASCIAELIIVNRGVNKLERQQIEAEMCWKWGLQDLMAFNNPYFNGANSIIISSVQQKLNFNLITYF